MIGGRNRPWILTVDTGDKNELFVAKFFSQQDIDQQNALSREVYANALAGELELNVPDMALITIGNSFKETLTDGQRSQLRNKHTQYAFGTAFISGTRTYSSALSSKQLKIYDVESIFAFDVLTLNTDRRTDKPNILLGDKSYYLIDHDHTFSIPTSNFNIRKRIGLYRFKQHIFYKVLNYKLKYGDEPQFDTFTELLRQANIEVLDPYFSLLRDEGYQNTDYFIIKRYLNEVKNNISDFLSIVRGGIQ